MVGATGASVNFESLSDLMGGDAVWLGGRSDLQVRVVSTLLGKKIRGAIWVRLLETSSAPPGTKRLFVLRRIAADHYWAVDWETLDAARAGNLLHQATGWLPPPCLS